MGARLLCQTCKTVEEVGIPLLRYACDSLEEASDEAQEVDTVAKLDNVAARVHRSIIFVQRCGQDCHGSEGKINRSKQAQKERKSVHRVPKTGARLRSVEMCGREKQREDRTTGQHRQLLRLDLCYHRARNQPNWSEAGKPRSSDRT
jgi:hypothetical protein